LDDGPRCRDEQIAGFLAKQRHDRLDAAGLIVPRVKFCWGQSR
jgi:hypothetical protein